MRRISSFVVLDVLITVPLIVICLYSFFFGTHYPAQWFWWAFVACLCLVVVPSAIYFFGNELPRSFAAVLICVYVLMLPALFYGLLYKIHTGAFNISIYCVLIVTVAKSIYAACMVTKSHG